MGPSSCGIMAGRLWTMARPCGVAVTTQDDLALSVEPRSRRDNRPAEDLRTTPTVAVLLPCYNEQATIGRVVAEFRASLPTATLYVYDNASNDRTADVARSAGATVRVETRRGKGNVMRTMFADIDADVYVIADGDGTYDASVAPRMVHDLLSRRLDMVVGARDPVPDDRDVYRTGHITGNALFSRALRTLFGGDFTDIFSGYRVMSRRFVKSFPVFSAGFEIETELSAHAVRVMARSTEVRTSYRSREADSVSKLRTYRDGCRIFFTMVRLFEEMRPLQFFTICSALLTALALGLGVPVVNEFAHTGYVDRFPTAILAVSIQIVAFLCFASGVILRSVGRARDETRRLAYLGIPHPGPTHGS
jgi:glycosyltransferase involved in cell wall biosynthesis